MTKVFLERISLKPENEQLILEIFSQKSLIKVKEFNSKERTSLRKITDRKLNIDDILVFQ